MRAENGIKSLFFNGRKHFHVIIQPRTQVLYGLLWKSALSAYYVNEKVTDSVRCVKNRTGGRETNNQYWGIDMTFESIQVAIYGNKWVKALLLQAFSVKVPLRKKHNHERFLDQKGCIL